MAPTGEKNERARAYVLAHPHETKRKQAKAIGVSETLIARVRSALVTEGLLAPSRKTQGGLPTSPRAPSGRSTDEGDAPAAYPGMRDHQAMLALGDIVDASSVPDDDAEVHRKLLRQCLSFAFNTELHPDTRMSASQMWAKLRDLGKSSQLGPGAPLTFDAGVERLRDVLVACGPKMTMAAVNLAFDSKESTDGEAKDDQAAPPGGTPEAPGPA